MKKNLTRYYQAWELRQQGKKLLEIAHIMGYKSGENARHMICFVDFRISNRKSSRISKELEELATKYNKI